MDKFPGCLACFSFQYNIAHGGHYFNKSDLYGNITGRETGTTGHDKEPTKSRSARGRTEEHSMGELTKKKELERWSPRRKMGKEWTNKKEQGRWLSTKENGHKKRVQQGTTGHARAQQGTPGHAIQAKCLLFDVVRGRQGLVLAGDPCNAPGSKSLPERVAHTLLPKLYISVT